MRIISYEETVKQERTLRKRRRDTKMYPSTSDSLKTHPSAFLKVMFSGVGVEKMFNIR